VQTIYEQKVRMLDMDEADIIEEMQAKAGIKGDIEEYEDPDKQLRHRRQVDFDQNLAAHNSYVFEIMLPFMQELVENHLDSLTGHLEDHFEMEGMNSPGLNKRQS
jgi:hypothetical protein